MDAKKKTIRNWLAVIVTVVFFAFQMYLALVKQLNPMLQSPLHLILALTLVSCTTLPTRLTARK